MYKSSEAMKYLHGRSEQHMNRTSNLEAKLVAEESEQKEERRTAWEEMPHKRMGK